MLYCGEVLVGHGYYCFGNVLASISRLFLIGPGCMMIKNSNFADRCD